MKIKDGKVISKNEEKEFRQDLKRILNDWFGVKLKDLPKLIEKLGVTDESYKINFVDSDEQSITISVKAAEELKIKFFRGKMIWEYAFCAVTKKSEKPEIYCISKEAEIQKLEDVIDV